MNHFDHLTAWRLQFALLSILLSGCANEEIEFPIFDACAVNVNAGFNLGTGERQFEALRDSSPLDLVAGFQGGYHLYAAISIPEVEDPSAKVLINLCQDGQVIGRSRELIDDGDSLSGFQAYGVYVYLLHDFLPEQVQDRESLMVAQVIDKAGRRWQQQVTVRPRCCLNLLDPTP